MESIPVNTLCPVLFLPHGGGPLPLLGDPAHQEMVRFLGQIASDFTVPASILVVSAHWEEPQPTITSSKFPPLIYDYFGFPPESYEITYPVLGNPELADKIYRLLRENNLEARLDDQRGLDHGVYVPLKIMYPEAKIPCVQLSLVEGLDPGEHIRLGKSLSKLREDNVLVVGSGFSFHNLRALMSSGRDTPDPENDAFQQWLMDTCTSPGLSEKEREEKLLHWEDAPNARYCHPREEHLLPLHVCYGLAGSVASPVFGGKVLGKKVLGFLWR